MERECGDGSPTCSSPSCAYHRDREIRRRREAVGTRRKIGRKRERENEIKRAFIDVRDPAVLVVLFVSGHKMDNLLSVVSIHCVFTVGHHNKPSF